MLTSGSASVSKSNSERFKKKIGRGKKASKNFTGGGRQMVGVRRWKNPGTSTTTNFFFFCSQPVHGMSYKGGYLYVRAGLSRVKTKVQGPVWRREA